ncbi:TlpA disulfide reductase family protein [Dyadobacter sp. CY312]|uniref:TlpA family protein disulfide reductase n=1 Tax=Dyadobacter sp. CY312 TaxID=2907303 RepID=UPI001F15C937|nr:TlpA disulfide reductase family protein [Dyadobacter sp. CY312]MCE7042906.1 TlpA family protein disulfide reductase [Dyadobacter sp. CY312]
MFLKRFKGLTIHSQFMLLVLSLYHVQAQSPITLTTEQSGNFTNVKKYINESPNQDSAFVYIVKFSKDLTKETKGLLSDEIHYPLAQMLIDTSGKNASEKKEFATTLLGLLTRDTTTELSTLVRPLDLWMKIQASAKNPTQVTTLINKFIKNEVESNDLYASKSGRYGVLIYKAIVGNPALSEVSEQLFVALSKQFGNAPISVTESTPYDELRRRSWLRYIYASLNLLRAINTQNLEEKESSLKIAFKNSPDRIDLTNYGFYYDMPFLFGADKISFQSDYLTFLTQQKADNNKLIPVLLEMSLADPTHKSQLEEVYGRTDNNKMSFEAYWLENVNSRSANIPPIELSMLDDKKFLGKELNGKWILIDFWGTWCAPCREEHPDLENLYQSYIKPKQDKMTVLTIACNDKKDKVLGYIQEKKFTFPVAMSDGKVEKSFAVTYYPTKLLITPQGKYLRVPNGKNWVEFVKLYTGL